MLIFGDCTYGLFDGLILLYFTLFLGEVFFSGRDGCGEADVCEVQGGDMLYTTTKKKTDGQAPIRAETGGWDTHIAPVTAPRDCV